MVVRVLVHDREHEEPALRTLRFARKVLLSTSSKIHYNMG